MKLTGIYREKKKKKLFVSLSLQYFVQSWETISIFFKTEIDDSSEAIIYNFFFFN